MKKIVLLPLTVSVVLITGCDSEETFTRYPSVRIPEYQIEDYTRDLSDPEPELVYNAVCNLGSTAGQFSKTLCADDADPASQKYKRADETYRTVCSLLEAKESYTVAASLRFLQFFERNYQPKEELLEIVSHVESSNPQVQFEQVTLLQSLVSENSQVSEALLRRLLESPSWIVSRTTYELVGRLQDNPLRQELVRRYRNTEDERERLILIAALSERLEPEEARMLEEEMFTTETPEIRRAIGSALMNNLGAPAVRPWFQDHFMELNDEEKSNLFMACLCNSDEADIDLACQLVAKGFIPDDEILEGLAEPPATDEEEEDRTLRLRMEQAIQANPKLAGRLQDMKEEAQREIEQRNGLQKDMAPVVVEFLDTTKAVLAKHEIPDEDQEKLLEELNKNLASLIDSK